MGGGEGGGDDGSFILKWGMTDLARELGGERQAD